MERSFRFLDYFMLIIIKFTREWPAIALMSHLFPYMASHHFDVLIKLISYILKPI